MVTSAEFVIWFRGFVDGAHDFNVTPKQWDLIKEKLKEVNDNPLINDPNTFKIHEPYNPFNFRNIFTNTSLIIRKINPSFFI